MRKKKYQTLIHVSSSEIYGTAQYTPIDEQHPTVPTTPYAASKLACDHIILSYYRTFGLDVSIVRPFNTYGERQNEGTYAAVIPLTIKRILSGNPPIIQGDGLQTRDFSYVDDVAVAIPQVYTHSNTRGRVVNLASGTETAIKILIHLIMDLTHYQGEIEYTPTRLCDVRRHCGDASLAHELFGYTPKTDYSSGLKKTIEWYRSKYP